MRWSHTSLRNSTAILLKLIHQLHTKLPYKQEWQSQLTLFSLCSFPPLSVPQTSIPFPLFFTCIFMFDFQEHGIFLHPLTKRGFFLSYFAVVLLKVEAEGEARFSAGISSRKFLVNGSLLKMLGIEDDSHKGECIHYRENCSEGTCCANCYCKYFTLDEGPTPLCDGMIGC